MPGKNISKHLNTGGLISLLAIATGLFYWLDAVLQMTATVSATDALVSVLLLYIFFLCINYIPAFKLSKEQDVIHFAVYALLFAVAWVYACKYILLYLFSSHGDYVLIWNNHLFIRGFVGWLVIYGYCIILRLQSSLFRLQDEMQDEEQAQQLRKDAELFKLRQQLQPHFLFNSLNSINALIGREPQRARQMVQQLSDYLRNTIKKEDNSFISFGEEMDDLRLYLAIEQVRFGHRLHVEEHLELECEGMKVPPFLLQPLVENAIKYGLYGTTGSVIINITVRAINKELLFTISNPYDADTVTVKGTGFGLESIRRRLYLLFARNDLLKITQGVMPGADTESSGLRTFTVTLTIPFEDHK